MQNFNANFLTPLVSTDTLIQATPTVTDLSTDLPTIEQLGFDLIQTTTTPWQVEHYQLRHNGLTVIYHPYMHQKIVSIQSWFQVGSANERKGKTGLAHLFEHLMFKETSTYPEGTLDRTLEELGGEINACTWLDWTCYEADAPLIAWEKILMFEADRLQNLQLNTNLLEAERKVVMNERLETVEDDFSALLDEQLYALAFPKHHPYAHSCIGSMEDIQHLSLQDCDTFYQTHYAVNRCTLVISGAVDRLPLLQTIHMYYASILASQIPAPPPLWPSTLVADHSQTSIHIIDDLDTQILRIHIGWTGFSILDTSYPALVCLDEVLCQGENALLYQDLILDKAWVSEIYTALPATRLEGLYEMTLHVNRTDITPTQILESIDHTLRHIIDCGIEDQVLIRVKRQQELYYHLQNRTLKQKTTHLGLWHTIAHDFTRGFNLAQAYQTVTSTHLQNIASMLCQPQRKTVVLAPIYDQ